MKKALIERLKELGFVAWIIGLGFVIGGGLLIYQKTLSIQHANAERQIFKESKSYNEGMVQDLSRDKLELSQTKDNDARNAIIEHILEKYSNFDENRIENRDLRSFLIDIRNGNIQ